MSKNVNIGITIGRFSPCHVHHESQIFKPMVAECAEILVLLGSAFCARSFKNPFTFAERAEMIWRALHSKTDEVELFAKIKIAPIMDYPSDIDWKRNVLAQISAHLKYLCNLPEYADAKFHVQLYGANKDASSYYIQMFENVNIGDSFQIIPSEVAENPISATMVREALFSLNTERVKELLSPDVAEYVIRLFNGNRGISWLAAEEKEVKDRLLPYKGLPHTIFLTTDVVLIKNGKVLMIRRADWPGKDLLAFPGGHVENHETVLNAAVREMAEETNIRVTNRESEEVSFLSLLQYGYAIGPKLFDNPNRSIVGRTISHAWFLDLDSYGFDCTVEAGSDASTFEWIPVQDIMDAVTPDTSHFGVWLNVKNEKLKTSIFEDHAMMIAEMAKENLNR